MRGNISVPGIRKNQVTNCKNLRGKIIYLKENQISTYDVDLERPSLQVTWDKLSVTDSTKMAQKERVKEHGEILIR